MVLENKRKKSHSFRAYLDGFQAKMLQVSYDAPASQSRQQDAICGP